MSPKLAYHLDALVELIPCSHHKSYTMASAEFCFKMAEIWLFISRTIFMQNSFVQSIKKSYLKLILI